MCQLYCVGVPAVLCKYTSMVVPAGAVVWVSDWQTVYGMDALSDCFVDVLSVHMDVRTVEREIFAA